MQTVPKRNVVLVTNMTTGDHSTLQHVDADNHHCYRTLSQLEMDAVGVLLEFTPANPFKEPTGLQWSRKRKRSSRLGGGDYNHKTREKPRRAKIPTFDGGDRLPPHTCTLINIATSGKPSKDLNGRATSPNSPLPSSQMQIGTIELGALSVLQEVPEVEMEETILKCNHQSVPKAEEKNKQASISIDLDISRCVDVDKYSDPLMKPTLETKIQPSADQVHSKPANALLWKVLCRKLLKLAVRLGWEIKGMRHTKRLLMEELQLLKNQNFFVNQQYSSTKAIQTKNASKMKLPFSAQDRCIVIEEGDEGAAGGTMDFTSESIEHNLDFSAPTTPSSIDLNGQNSEECINGAPDCISWTSPRKDMNVPKAHVETIVEKEPSTTSKDARGGAHAELSFSTKHGFIDAHGTWVIAQDSSENHGNGVHAQSTYYTHEDSVDKADGVQNETQGDPCVDITSSRCKQKALTSCAEYIPAQFAAPHSSANQCVDSNPALRTAHSSLCAVFGASSHCRFPPPSLSFSIDAIPTQHTHYLQSPNHHVDNDSTQLLPCLPLLIPNHAAIAQLASSIYERLPQAIVLLCDRKFAFAEARRRRKEITRIKRHQSSSARASKLH